MPVPVGVHFTTEPSGYDLLVLDELPIVRVCAFLVAGEFTAFVHGRHYSRKQHRHADHTRRPTPQKPKHSATTLLSALLVLSSLLAMTAAQDQLMAVYKAAVTAHQSQDLTTALDKYREVLKLNPGIAAVQCVSHRPHLEPALSQHC